MDHRLLSVILLWHMHQPEYRDAATGRSLLPWVRLHAAKNYLAMARRLREAPGVRATFNLTPVLLDQVEALAGGAPDAHEEIARKPADALTEADRLFLLRYGFMVNWERYVDPHPRYRELLDRRGRTGPDELDPRVAARFGPADFRDLVVLFHLAWTDADLLEADPELRAIRNRPGGWSEAEKHRLLDAHRRAVAEVIPAYRALQESGAAELCTSPYFHPIGPLLLDQGASQEARPGAPLPDRTFAGRRDVAWHLAEAVRSHERRFGRRPAGLWPSEGGVSEAFLAMAAEHGFMWTASDDAILHESLRKAGHQASAGSAATPWTHGTEQAPLRIFFRDHTLSDLIGFVYARWDPAEAASDFIARLKEAGRHVPPGGGPPVLSVILDGENPWEHYPDSGKPFLRELYARLGSDPALECITPSIWIERHREAPRLDRVHAGSWINRDFSIWIGHPEDRTAWSLVAEARETLLKAEAELPAAVFAEAWRSLMAAEGSDWTWWYGDEHHTPLGLEFDALFRGHLRRLYELCGKIPPARLERPVRGARLPPAWSRPSGFVQPIVDGRVSNYFEWLAAGRYNVTRAGTAMHRPALPVEEIHFGLDAAGNLHVRVDPAAGKELGELTILVLEIAAPTAGECRFASDPVRGWIGEWIPSAESQTLDPLDLVVAYHDVVEIAVRPPSGNAGFQAWEFRVILRDRSTGATLDRWPADGQFTATREDAESASQWVV
jgi:alpha-amylase/alpha-mannosidase (GH57 family)